MADQGPVTDADDSMSTVAPADLIAFFTLSESDLAQIPVAAAPHNQLGFALQRCALRYLGFAPGLVNSEMIGYPPTSPQGGSDVGGAG